MADHRAVAGPGSLGARRAAAARRADVRLLGPALLGWGVLAAGLALPVGVHACLALGALLVSIGLVRWCHTPVLRSAALGAAIVALVEVALTGHVLVRTAGPLDELARAHAVVTLEVVVTGEPMPLRGGLDGRPVVLVRADARRLLGRGREGSVHAPVLLRGDERLLTLRWHERVRVVGRSAPTDSGSAEMAQLRVTAPPRSLEPPGAVARGAEHLRAGLRRAMTGTPDDARGLLPGLVIGDTSRTPDDLTEAMRATGMTHLTAVSGANVAIVLGLVMGLASIVGVPRRLRPVVAGLALAGFVVLARPEPSVVRAATMGAIGLVGLSRSRRGAGLPVLAAAVVGILVIDPWMSRSYGFVLSTLATLGLLLFTRPWGDAIARRLPRRLRALGPVIAIPVAAQAMCAPVIVLLQGSVSLVGVVANLAAAPLVPVATIAGVAAALLAVASDPVAHVAAWVGAVPTLAIAKVARVLADVPGGTLDWPDGPLGAVLLAALTVALLLTGRWVADRSWRHPVAASAVVAVAASGLVPTRLLLWPPDGWRVAFCDVGQGDAAVLRSGTHSAVLVDAGPDPTLVDGCLRRLDIDRLDAVVLTHFHADHVEGLPGALGGRRVGGLLTTPFGVPDFQVREVMGWARAAAVPVAALASGDRLDVGQVHAEVWSPARRIDAGSVPNNASVVLSVHIGQVDVLLMGDIERESAHDLLLRLRRDAAMSAESVHVDALKSPHHGSANLDPELMAAVRAPVAVVSVGADNDYGHPTAYHLGVLRANGCAVWRTDRRGDIALVERDGAVAVASSR